MKSLTWDVVTPIIREVHAHPGYHGFRCHEVARVYAAMLRSRGIPTEVEDGVVSYQRTFLARLLYGAPPTPPDQEYGDDPSLLDLAEQFSYVAKSVLWNSVVGSDTDQFTVGNHHSYCRVGSSVLDHHPGAISLQHNAVITTPGPFLLDEHEYGEHVRFRPCGREERRGDSIHLHIDDYDTEIHPTAVELINGIEKGITTD